MQWFLYQNFLFVKFVIVVNPIICAKLVVFVKSGKSVKYIKGPLHFREFIVDAPKIGVEVAKFG